MVVSPTDLVLKLSGGIGNCDSAKSLGGEISTVPCGIIVSNKIDNVFDMVTNQDLSDTIVGTYNYRCIYIYNNNPHQETLQNVQVWLDLNTISPFTDVDIGLGLSAVGEIEQTIEDEYTPPKFIGWTTARSEEFAVNIGNLPPGSWKAIWIRRHAGPAPTGTSFPSDYYIIRYKCHKIGIGAPTPPPGTPPPSTPPPPPPSSSDNDQFGIRKIFPDALPSSSVSSPFYLTNATTDCRFKSSVPVAVNTDGSWKSGPSNLRMYIGGVSGCSKDTVDSAINNLDTYNHSVWASRGYIYRPHDWKAIEITGQFKIVNATNVLSGGDWIEYRVRGVLHTQTISNGCAGTAYQSRLFDDGKFTWAKEQFHNPSIACGNTDVLTPAQTNSGSLRDKWFGYKLIIWNYIEAGTNRKAVHMEAYIDKDANNTWVKIAEKDDVGNWYPGAPSTSCVGGTYCGGERDQILTWGSPVVEIGWNQFQEVHFRHLSVREIMISATPTPPPSPPPATPSKLSISSITAKGNDGNVPQNVNDANLSTRWSHSPVPSWIKLNLGSAKTLNSIKIAWYNGNTRVMGFRVDGENDNGADKVTLFSGNSSGATSELETYNFTTTVSRKYVVVHVLTNSSNSWASITEIEVLGSTATTPPPPPGTPPPSTGSDLDVFGIKKIYTTKIGDQTEWASTTWSNGKSRTVDRDQDLSSSECVKDPYDSKLAITQVGNPYVTINGSGIMKVDSMPNTTGSPRVIVLGTWRNVESTIYVKVSSVSKLSVLTDMRMKTDHYCVGSGGFGGYILDVNFMEDKIYFKREESHSIGYTPRTASVDITLPANTWIGIKGICYNLSNGHVRLEAWIDMNGGVDGGNWVKRTETTDEGTWSGAGGGTPIFTSSHKGSAIRSNLESTDSHVEYKWWTVREIQPPI